MRRDKSESMGKNKAGENKKAGERESEKRQLADMAARREGDMEGGGSGNKEARRRKQKSTTTMLPAVHVTQAMPRACSLVNLSCSRCLPPSSSPRR